MVGGWCFWLLFSGREGERRRGNLREERAFRGGQDGGGSKLGKGLLDAILEGFEEGSEIF